MHFKTLTAALLLLLLSLSLSSHANVISFPSLLHTHQKLFSFVLSATFLALSATFVSGTENVNFVVDQDNSEPFFVGSEKLSGISTALSTAATDNAAISSLLDAALSQKYDNATIKAWRRMVSGKATLVASSGPALSGELKCFVGSNGEVVGLQYGSAVVCQKSSRVVNVKIGTNFVSNIKVGGLVFFIFSSLHLYILSSFWRAHWKSSVSSSESKDD